MLNPTTRRHRPAPGTVIASIALLAALGSGAYAAIPAEDGTIHGCYANSNGGLRLSDQACKNSETAISWNQRGPKGERGEVGPQGPPGPPGPAGAPGGGQGFADHNRDGLIMERGGSFVAADKLLPPGSYLLSASVDVSNSQGADNPLVWCDLRRGLDLRIPGNSVLYETTLVRLGGLDQPGSSHSFSLDAALTFDGGRVYVVCHCPDPNGRTDAAINEAALTAIKVDSVG